MNEFLHIKLSTGRWPVPLLHFYLPSSDQTRQRGPVVHLVGVVFHERGRTRNRLKAIQKKKVNLNWEHFNFSFLSLFSCNVLVWVLFTFAHREKNAEKQNRIIGICVWVSAEEIENRISFGAAVVDRWHPPRSSNVCGFSVKEATNGVRQMLRTEWVGPLIAQYVIAIKRQNYIIHNFASNTCGGGAGMSRDDWDSVRVCIRNQINEENPAERQSQFFICHLWIIQSTTATINGCVPLFCHIRNVHANEVRA